MPRRKSTEPKKKLNFYVPEDLLAELQLFRRVGETDTDFYTRMLEEAKARLQGILTGETPVDPTTEAQVLAVLKKYGITLPNICPPESPPGPSKK